HPVPVTPLSLSSRYPRFGDWRVVNTTHWTVGDELRAHAMRGLKIVDGIPESPPCVKVWLFVSGDVNRAELMARGKYVDREPLYASRKPRLSPSRYGPCIEQVRLAHIVSPSQPSLVPPGQPMCSAVQSEPSLQSVPPGQSASDVQAPPSLVPPTHRSDSA